MNREPGTLAIHRSTQMDHMGRDLAQVRSDMSRLGQAFSDFVDADFRAKELSLAETRQAKLRQEIESRFGQNDRVRRHAIGILQAADVQLVRHETLRGATEELMLSAPGYWLAPALVALAAWLADDHDLAQRAVAESLRRDDEKTSLFFALVTRRACRNEASRAWLDRFFGLQNPLGLDRQAVIMVDAMANGVFAADAVHSCSRRIAAWIEELSRQADFAEAQRSQWIEALRAKAPRVNHARRYPHLARYSSTWQLLNDNLNAAGMQSAVLQHFQKIFDGEIRPASNVLRAVDSLLDALITHFDDEELELRRQEELCKLIIEENGDIQAAQDRYQQRTRTLDEQVDIMQLLANAAMHPENTHASRATQRLAIAHLRGWILDAHADITARARNAVAQKVFITLEDWQGESRQGDNEADLLSNLNGHLDQREAHHLSAARTGFGPWLAMAVGFALVLMGINGGPVVLLLGMIVGNGAYAIYAKKKKRRAEIRLDAARLKQQSTQALRACLAELVELRRELAQSDAVAANVTALLEGISPDHHLQPGHNTVRRVLSTAP